MAYVYRILGLLLCYHEASQNFESVPEEPRACPRCDLAERGHGIPNHIGSLGSRDSETLRLCVGDPSLLGILWSEGTRNPVFKTFRMPGANLFFKTPRVQLLPCPRVPARSLLHAVAILPAKEAPQAVKRATDGASIGILQIPTSGG